MEIYLISTSKPLITPTTLQCKSLLDFRESRAVARQVRGVSVIAESSAQLPRHGTGEQCLCRDKVRAVCVVNDIPAARAVAEASESSQ